MLSSSRVSAQCFLPNVRELIGYGVSAPLAYENLFDSNFPEVAAESAWIPKLRIRSTVELGEPGDFARGG